MLCLLCLVCGALAALAKGDLCLVQMLEGEARIGCSQPLGGYHSGRPVLSNTSGLELRYNFYDSPWSCGIMVDLSNACRIYDYQHVLTCPDNRHHSTIERFPGRPGFSLWEFNNTTAFAIVGEYNFRQGTKINPFAGMAAGLGRKKYIGAEDISDDRFEKSEGSAFYMSLRAGVEVFYHFRVNVQLNFTQKGYNTSAMTVALVIGGRPKKLK